MVLPAGINCFVVTYNTSCERFQVDGTGGSHTQLTETLPKAGSASLLNAPGLTSISEGLQPTPAGLLQLIALPNHFDNGSVLTSIYHGKVDTMSLSHGSDFVMAQRIGVWV